MHTLTFKHVIACASTANKHCVSTLLDHAYERVSNLNLHYIVTMFPVFRRRVCWWGLSLQSRQLLPGEVAVGGSRRDANADGVREGKPVATLHCRPVLRCCGSRAAARWRCGAPGLQRTRAQRAIEWRQFERFYFQTSNYCVSLIANTSKLVGLLNISRKIGGCRNFYISHKVIPVKQLPTMSFFFNIRVLGKTVEMKGALVKSGHTNCWFPN